MWRTAERRLVPPVCLRNAFSPDSRYSFQQRRSTHEEIGASVRLNYWVGSHDPARTSSGSMFELWISDGFEWFFALNFLYPNLLSSLHPSNSYSCLSQWSFDQIFWFVVSKAICCGILQKSPTFPCKQGHEAMKNCRDSLPEAWGPWEPQYAPPARSMSELWISDGFEWFFALNFLYPNLLSSLDPSNSYSCLSQWSFDQIFWFAVSKPICCGILQKTPTFPCKQGHEAMKNCRDSLPEAWGPWEPQYAPPALQYSVSKSWIAGYWFWSRLSYIASASSQRRVVQIQLLASVGWKWGCQPFSWRCLQNVTHCRKETCSTCLFKECILARFPLFFPAKTFNSWRDRSIGKVELLSWESRSGPNIVRVDVWVVNQWWIWMIFRSNFSVPKFAVLAPSKQLILMPVTVKFRSDFLVCGLQSHLLWHLAKVAHISM